MPEGKRNIECTACGAPVTGDAIDPKEPCPYCGCFGKMVRLRYSESISSQETYKMKAVNHETKKKVAWSKGGDDFQWSTGRMLHLDRSFDKEKDLYTELLIDPKTGEIVKDINEPLTKHTDHGAAKKGKA